MLTSVQVNERCYTVFKSQSLKSCDDQVNGLQKNNTEQLGKVWGEGEEWGRGLEFKPTPHSLVFSDRALFTIWWNHQSLMAAVSHQLQADISSVWFSVGLRNTGCGSETESESGHRQWPTTLLGKKYSMTVQKGALYFYIWSSVDNGLV